MALATAIKLRFSALVAPQKGELLTRVLRALAMGRLLGAIPADGHAAPPPCMPACPIHEQQHAVVSLASFHVCEILVADQIGHCFRDRE
jgi:hypothetical protein